MISLAALAGGCPMALPLFSDQQLEAICQEIADTSAGLTGSEIGRLLSQAGIPDPDADVTKWRRLCHALHAAQANVRSGNIVGDFIQRAMDPLRYVGRTAAFEERRAGLNRVLAFAGIAVGDDGKLRTATSARTLNEADRRLGRLRAELERRQVHADVLACCRAELVEDENFFHAVLEATKSIAKKVREKSGLGCDGAQLVDEAFGMGSGLPRLAFNSLRTETEQSEHKGLTTLMKGVFGAFRNPTAHAPKVEYRVTEQDALDILSVASLIHRRLDLAVRTATRT